MSILSVDNISPIGSGTSVTVNSAATLVLTNANSTGVVTATTFSGSGASLTNLPAANLTGTLPAISGANLTGVLSNIVEDTSPQLGGNLASNGNNINIADSTDGSTNRITVGSAGDLQIYHDSNDSYIQDAGAGHLNILATNFRVRNADSDEIYIVANDDGAVELYHNNSQKFTTSSSGVTISADTSTGSLLKGVTRFCPSGSTTVKAMWDETGFSGAGHFQVKDGVAFTAGNSSDLKIYHDGSDSLIKDTGTGALKVCSNLFRVNNAANTEAMIKAEENAGVTLSYDASTKFETMSTGARIQGGLLFNSDTAAANTLDDYEEGSYVVTVTGSGSGSFALNPNSFRYTKIGRTVHVTGRFYIVSGSPTGSEARVSLPFTASSDIQAQDGRGYSYVTTYNAYSPNNDYQMANEIIQGSAHSVLIWVVPNAAWQSVSPSSHLNQRNAYYGFDFTYTTAT